MSLARYLRAGLKPLAAVALAGLVSALVPSASLASAIDSLACRMEGERLLLDLRLDAAGLAVKEVQDKLDRQLRIECVVSITVNQPGFLGANTVLASRVKRTITFSRMRREFSITEGGEEIYYDDSYFRTLQAFVGFDDLPVLDASHLDVGKEYYVQLAVEVRYAVPPETRGGRGPIRDAVDTVGAITQLVGSEEPILAEERRSCPFKPELITPTLFRDVCTLNPPNSLASEYSCVSRY